MVHEQKQQAAVNEVLVWLEDELRETKTQLVRLEQGLAEAEAHIAELTEKVHHTESGAAGITSRLAEIPQITGQVGTIRTSLAGVEEQALTSERRLNEGLRLQQIEIERLRHELNGTYRRIELIERSVETWGPRFDHLEETDRRIQEAVTLVRHQHQDLERRHDAGEANVTRGTEAFKRFEHELGSLGFAIQEQLKHEAAAADRLQAFSEAVRRLDEQNETVAAKVVAQQEIFEKIDLLRAELRRLADRLSTGETNADEHRSQLDDHSRLLGLLEGRDRGLGERLGILQEELQAHRGQVNEQFHQLHQALDRQKRREIESLERDLRELKLSAFRAPDDAPPI